MFVLQTGEAEVKELFSGIGPIQDISLPRDGQFDAHTGQTTWERSAQVRIENHFKTLYWLTL